VTSSGKEAYELFVVMECHAISLAIALETFQIGVVICQVMEDRRAAIPAGEDMMEPARDAESWLAGHGEKRSGWRSNKVNTHA
jgi:hypothetical protein